MGSETFKTRNVMWQRAKSSFALLLVVSVVLFLSLQDAEAFHVLLGVLSEAYIAVSVFVAFTLAIFYTLESVFSVDTQAVLKKYKHFQVPIASILGALPGCGGAIIVVTQFVRGRISFGSVVAVLIATMGDAAFLLLAQEPKTGVFVMAVSVIAAIISGYIVDKIHSEDFLRPSYEESTRAAALEGNGLQPFSVNIIDALWLLLVVPGLLLGFMGAFQVEAVPFIPSSHTEDFLLYFGAVGAVLSCAMWIYSALIREHKKGESYGTAHNIHMSSEKDHLVHRVIQDTNFVTTWVVLAFFIFEMFVHMTGIDLSELFGKTIYLVLFIAIIIGFIPGCGPQVLVTALYLNNALPLSAQLGNAISNDGDALFPAIALAPKAAVVATLYSAVPAFIVAYGYMWLFES